MIRNAFFNLSDECVQLRQMMKNDQHIGNVMIVFCFCLFLFLRDDRNDSERSARDT